MSRSVALVVITLFALTGCASSGASSPPTTAGTAPPATSRTMVVVTQAEPTSLSEHRALYSTSAGGTDAKRLFNAGFYLADDQGVPRPLLIEQGPELNTDSWRVNPDGSMDTVYRLRSDVTWHDGAPLTADDMVLSWQMAVTPDYGVSELKPMNLMANAVAIDTHTVALHWKTTYPGANAISGRDWSPLPSHLLGSAFQTEAAQTFLARAYWTTQFVGLGPYRLAEWQPGASISGVAFDGYVRGRPKIGRIDVRVAGDPNVVVALLLSGAAHLALDKTLGFEQGALLERQWATNHDGTVLLSANNLRTIQVQFKSEYVGSPEIQDVRVRQALAYALDKQALLDGLQNGQGQYAEGFLVPGVDYYEAALRQITRYPHDLGQADRLLQSAGLTKPSDAFYTTADGKRFSPELRASASDQEARQQAIIASSWKELGVDVQSRLLSAEEYTSGELRSTYPTFFDADTAGITEEILYVKLYAPNAATAATRWQGSNRGGYSNPDYDRLFQQLTTSLERSAQVDAIMQAAKLISEQVIVYPLFYSYDVKAHLSAVHGPKPYAPTGDVTWGVEQWELTS